MRVALVEFGGFIDYTIQLANALAAFADIHLIFGRPVPAHKLALIDKRIAFDTFRKPNRDSHPKNLFVIRRIFRRIKELDPDLLHIQESQTPWFELGLSLERTKLPPVVITVHDAIAHPGDHPILFYQQTRACNIRKARVVIAHAQSVKRDLITRFRVAESSIRVLPHGELGSWFQKLSSVPVPQREERTILFFGRIVHYKGLEHLVEAMHRVQRAIPDAKLLIAGAGSDLPKQTRDLGITCELQPGFVPDDRVAELFQRSAALVMPYIEASQSGVAAIALGLGTPLIASAIGGLPEMIRNHEDGILVPPGDSRALALAIINMLSNRDLQSRMKRRMLARSEADLAWSDIARRTIGLYREALSNEALRAITSTDWNSNPAARSLSTSGSESPAPEV